MRRQNFFLSNFKRTFSTYSSYGPSGYSNSLPAGIGYPGTDIRSHIESFDHDHHHHHHHDHELHESVVEPTMSTIESGSPSPAEKAKLVRRVYNQMRQFTNPIFEK